MRKGKTRKTTIMKIIRLEWLRKWVNQMIKMPKKLILMECHKRLYRKVDQILRKNRVMKEMFNLSQRIIMIIIKFLHRHLLNNHLRNHR